MTSISPGSTQQLILARFAELTPKLQQAARFVIDHPREVVTLSMRSVAELSGSKPATLVRLAQQLEFAGWPEFKESIFNDLGLFSARYGSRARDVVRRASSTDLLGEMFETQHQNLQSTQDAVRDSLQAAARLLKRSRAVHIAAFRASFSIGYALAYGYRLFRNDVTLMDGFAGALELQAFNVEKGDAVVVFGFTPYSREVLAVMEVAQAAQAKIIALTDSSASPLALAADVTIQFTNASPSYFPSLTAALAVTEALLELLIADAGEDALKRLEATEARLLESGAYRE